jgi:uncharacterized protein
LEIKPSLLFAKVMHKRLSPKVNTFNYNIYYLSFPLSQMTELADSWRFGVNKPGLLSFYEQDHGARDGSALLPWITHILNDYGLTKANGEIVLVTMPRVLGYVFNPVSFWFCLDREGGLRAVLSEVNNTFGERHCYLCAHPDQKVIEEHDIMHAQKLFHVSPFLHREGHYEFRFNMKNHKFGIWINYFDQQGKKLLTAMTGAVVPYTAANRRKAFWRYPMITYRAIFLIHWQAIKLFMKGIRYVSKPVQFARKITKN